MRHNPTESRELGHAAGVQRPVQGKQKAVWALEEQNGRGPIARPPETEPQGLSVE